LANLLDGTHIERIATNRIDGVGWVDDKATISQAVDHLVYLPYIGVLWIDFNKHIGYP
jgi:hypothetical protein